MNTSHIKSYAPKARTAFIAAVSKQAESYGISADGCLSAEVKGELLLIDGKTFPLAIKPSRDGLVQLVEAQGFTQVMDKVAYSWFNRLCAIRYMELHDYLGHGRRVLSHPEHPSGYQILDDCLDIDLPGLDTACVRELKLDGTQDEALYRELLLAQCRALHDAMPFLFEPINDATELLLPHNLTNTDSLIHDLVTQIPESDWQDIEIIGWLYQFYISEKKDEVIGKVVKSEDIPAATQLFTPNWIVKYMVQNSLGAQWLATYPDSPLKGQMEFYIEPAEQTDEVNAQLAAITPSSLDPEELTLIDPASGSGHILVEAYDLFKAIYLERGYRERDVPQLILQKNLFGLDIDERAAQLSGFALMMKGRADDRRLFERGVRPNVMALLDSAGFDAEALAGGIDLVDYGLILGDITELKRLFEHSTTFGSLIQVPEGLAEKLPALKRLSEATSEDLFVSEALQRLGPQVQQADLLTAQYDAVVANPPYMGSKFQTPLLKKFLKDKYAGYEKDFFSAFIDRELSFSKPCGGLGVVAPYVWMFISSYEELRNRVIEDTCLTSLIQLEYNAFEPAMIPVATFTLLRRHVPSFTGTYIDLSEFKGHQNQAPKTLEAINNSSSNWLFIAKPDAFRNIPGSPVAFSVTERVREIFGDFPAMASLTESSNGVQTGNNDRFVRLWQEVDTHSLHQEWIPYNKGGKYRKWYGNIEHVVLWANDGQEIKSEKNSCHRGERHYLQSGVTWSDVTSGRLSARYMPTGCIFDAAGPAAFAESSNTLLGILCLLNATETNRWSKILNPTLHFQCGDFRKLAFAPALMAAEIASTVQALVGFSERDWSAYERSWDFQSFPLLTASSEPTLESSYSAWINSNRDTTTEMKRLEEENNRLFIEAYGLADELTSDVPVEQITLTVNPAYRYGIKTTEAERDTRFREDSMQELVSYAIGCIMGRYSLDEPGLIYAHSGNEGFDASRYTTFAADDDGIVPLTDREWLEDDACNRLVEFISVAWDKAHLEENLRFLTDNLSPKKGEGSRDTLRRYLCDSFFKDHLKTYKKRPIYWLFSSGKQKAFQCLVYLHRYNESTLARMRTEYVIPLTAKLTANVQKLENDKDASDSAAESKRLEKQITKLHKQQVELSDFDEKLRHYADQRISLDLDDGVKVNYGMFGDLLAEVKAITSKAPS